MKITWLAIPPSASIRPRRRSSSTHFFTGNPGFEGLDAKDATKDITHILLTHGHGDHVGDTLQIAAETRADRGCQF